MRTYLSAKLQFLLQTHRFPQAILSNKVTGTMVYTLHYLYHFLKNSVNRLVGRGTVGYRSAPQQISEEELVFADSLDRLASRNSVHVDRSTENLRRTNLHN